MFTNSPKTTGQGSFSPNTGERDLNPNIIAGKDDRRVGFERGGMSDRRDDRRGGGGRGPRSGAGRGGRN